MKFSRIQISSVLAIAVFAWLIVLLAQGTIITPDHLKPFSTVVVVLVTLSLLTEHLLWRKALLQKWFVSMPDLRGTWEVVIESDWVDPKTGVATSPIDCFMGVKQTLSTLQMHLMTPESESWLTAHSINEAQSGHGYQITAVYTNKPSVHLRNHRSSIHLGALVMDTHGDNQLLPDTIIGEYWTDRKTTGLISLNNKVENVFTSFSDAKEHFSDY